MVNGGGQSGTADQDISFLNFGGGYFGTSAYLLDGHWDTAGDWGGVIYVPSMESVQEAKIQTNTFTAQYGWSTGNMYNVITKSGSSSFHGDAFEFLRNCDLDANFFFNNANGIARTAFRRNQFGVAGGGPVYIPGIYKQRNKTFFFAYYEGLRQGTAGSASRTPCRHAAEKSGDFSAISQVLYNPFSTVQTASGFTRTPIPGQSDPINACSARLRPKAALVLSRTRPPADWRTTTWRPRPAPGYLRRMWHPARSQLHRQRASVRPLVE